MSYLDDYPKMAELEESCGSRFAAIIQISDMARNEVDKSYHLLSGSQALSYLLSETLPDKIGKISKKNHFRYADYLIQQVEDDLVEISDKSIRDSVRDSLYKSFENGYLIYDYKGIESEHRQGRIRILCKILWDKVIH